METLSRYVGWTFDYILQMLPCCVLTAAVFLALLPVRKKRLARLGLVSRPRREALLFLFVLFCAGLMALTLFPAGFWGALMAGHLPPEGWFACRGSGMYLRITLLSELTEGGAWTWFMLLGNAVMFVPLGFFPALLWRRARWWKSVLAAGGTSLFVELWQLFIDRSSDINDLILNTLGGLLGFGLYVLLSRLLPDWTGTCQVEEQYGRETGDSGPASGA